MKNPSPHGRFGIKPGAKAGPKGGAKGGGKTPRTLGPQGEYSMPRTTTPALPPVESFSELGLPPELVTTMADQGVAAPFPIQAATLPNSLAGRDILGRGRTGSGKTLAFGLALLARTAGQQADPKRPLALVLVPTRELAQQVTEALAPYAQALKLRVATVVGGLSIGKQTGALRTGAEIVVATPGRLSDLIGRRDVHLERVKIVVLDEADQMCDMGFMPQVTEILDQCHHAGQRMLFSATLDRNVDALVQRYLKDPVGHSVDPQSASVSTMDHHVLHIHAADKVSAATEIAAREGRVLMFLDTKHGVDQFVKHLRAMGVRAEGLHSGKSQPQRTRTLGQFKDGLLNVLVATNVAARGIHIEDLDLVVNVDPPADSKDYLHRGGRTARAGESGKVVTLVTPNQRRDIVRLMADAKIRPTITQVRSGEAALSRITGAKAPSGVPLAGAAATDAKGRPSGSDLGFRGIGTRPGRPGKGKESRKTIEARQAAEARAAARVRRGTK